MTWSAAQIRAAWTHLRDNRDEVLESENCVCVECGHRFKSSEIAEWLNPTEGTAFTVDPEPTAPQSTAFCPNCHMDYVLGDASDLPIHDEHFLKAMHS